MWNEQSSFVRGLDAQRDLHLRRARRAIAGVSAAFAAFTVGVDSLPG
jgi:hypothetical protein